MPNSNFLAHGMTYAQLSELLQGMGFQESVSPKSHVFWTHASSGAEVALPIYRPNQAVLPHHLVTVRLMLDGKGLMDAGDFDERVALAPAKQSAS